MHIVDADRHVAEGATLALACMDRWPDKVTLRTDGRPSLNVLLDARPEPITLDSQKTALLVVDMQND